MAARFSTGFRNFILMNGSAKRFLQGAVVNVYSGPQVADADTAPAGTLLNTITLASGAYTPEVLSAGSLTLAGTVGTVTGITVNGVQILGATCTFATTLTQLAIDIAAQINSYVSSPEYTAVASSNKVTVYANVGTGTAPNGLALVTTGAGGITSTDVNMGTEVTGVAAANGITWGLAASGVLSKSGVWSGVGLADGTPGWYRIARSQADMAGASTSLRRIDGAISTSSAELNINPCISNTGVTLTIDSFSGTEPAA